MENTNEILNGIVNQSIKNVICVDDDFLEPYEDVMETNKEKCIFSRQMYSAISSSCECAVTIIPYKQEADVKIINDKMRQKDLLILDYVEVSQLDSLKANNNLEEHIKEFFEVDKLQLGIISSMIKNIYDEYPKWIKKGDI